MSVWITKYALTDGILEADAESCGGNKRYAKQILLTYNQNLKANRLEDKF